MPKTACSSKPSLCVPAADREGGLVETVVVLGIDDHKPCLCSGSLERGARVLGFSALQTAIFSGIDGTKRCLCGGLFHLGTAVTTFTVLLAVSTPIDPLLALARGRTGRVEFAV